MNDAPPNHRSSPRVAVIGDVGGHHQPLADELIRLGADPTSGWIPADLTIVQVGDLVHRGPHSEEVIALVNRCLCISGDRWIQLIGNHEALYVRRPVFDWPEHLDHATVDTLRRWWADGSMQVATVVRSGRGDMLVTHAGVTFAFWSEVLGAPSTVDETAGVLNRLAAQGDRDIFRAGQMLGGGAPTPLAGPLWAAAATELLPSWLDRVLPFGQVHGHSTCFDRQRDVFRGSPQIQARTRVDLVSGHETTALNGGDIVGVDPGHGAAAQRWRAWES